jgi:hypothetical protein
MKGIYLSHIICIYIYRKAINNNNNDNSNNDSESDSDSDDLPSKDYITCCLDVLSGIYLSIHLYKYLSINLSNFLSIYSSIGLLEGLGSNFIVLVSIYLSIYHNVILNTITHN